MDVAEIPVGNTDEPKEAEAEILDDLWNFAILSNQNNAAGNQSGKAPQKSSDEILSELFESFNAKPPNSPKASQSADVKSEDSASKSAKSPRVSQSENEGVSKSKKKRKKKHKDRKHKKKRRKHSSNSDGDMSDSGKPSESHKAKKRKKHKKSRHRDSSDHCESENKISSNGHEPIIAINDGNAPPPASDSKTMASELSLTTESVEKPTSTAKETPSSDNSSKIDSEPLGETKIEEAAVSDSVKIEEKTSDKPTEQNSAFPEKPKAASGKITIKNLKFSSVYQATVKEVEEQAKLKADQYEEGEISDTSESRKSSSDTCDGGDAISDSRTAGSKPDVNSQSESSKTGNSKDKKSLRRSHSPVETSSSHRKRSKHRSPSRDPEKRKKDKDKDRDKEKPRHKDRDNNKNKDRYHNRDKNRDRERRHGRSRTKSRSRTRSRSRSRRKSRSRSKRRSRSRDRERRRERRSPSGERIDKKKLLEIARRNAMSMLQQGILPPSMGAGLSQVDKPKSTAKTVDELTNFCKQLSKRENLGDLSTLSDEDTDSEKPFHHPFQVKDKPGIVMNIKNATQLPVKTLQEKSAEQSKLRIQFPVSSGQLHRKTESEWVPVSPKRDNSLALVPLPPNDPPPKMQSKETQKPKSESSHKAMEDIDAMVSQRLSEMRMLHDNTAPTQMISYPSNYQHHHQYSEAQSWQQPAPLPGLFTSNTKVRILTPAELASGTQAWACKDQLVSARPVQSGMGMTLLQKMGWKPGEGLGKNKEGVQIPLQLEVKLDRKGLVAQEELHGRKKTHPPQFQHTHNLTNQPSNASKGMADNQSHQFQQALSMAAGPEGKHPVSLLVEFCSKKHYPVPQFTVCQESGPDHKKSFLFRVRVNGMDYQAANSSPNKKQAKAEAATICLRALGVLSR